MGILNITPDSFYAGSRVQDIYDIVQKAGQMLEEGPIILDIGGQSTRPNAEEVGPETEKRRVLPVIERLAAEFPAAVLSIDTFHAPVADAALEAGAHIVNDVSGGQRDPEIYNVAAQHGAPYILMHMRGTAATMTQLTDYGDIVSDLLDYFREKAFLAQSAGIKDIILDPGFGFSKTQLQNYEVLKRLNELRLTGFAIVAGLSRKSMIYNYLGLDAENAIAGTVSANLIAMQTGASVLRVHEVKEAAQSINIWEMFN
jgi:dihydropteroate synthase